jgi:amidase
MLSQPTSWQIIAEKFQVHRDATIVEVEPPLPYIESLPLDSTPIPKSILTPEEISVTEFSREKLVSKLASGELTAVKVTNAKSRELSPNAQTDSEWTSCA